MNGARRLVHELEALGVDVVFGYPGGAIMPVYDALVGSGLRHVLTRHEQGAALAANGYARASGRVGVCIATSGPGATNLVTGIADAFMDSVPIVAITGQVPTTVLGTDAFQEVDTIGITLPIVKHSYIVRRVEDLVPIVREAFAIARSGRPGPVLIDLPKDVALADASEVTFDVPNLVRPQRVMPTASDTDYAAAAELVRRSERPVLLAGAGIALAGMTETFRDFIASSAIPVVTTLHGIGVLPTGHPRLLGMLGMHGSKGANLAVQESDLLICLGARLDDRATGKLDEFAPNAALIHLDIDPAELGKLRRPTVALAGDLATTLPRFARLAPCRPQWLARCVERGVRFAFCYDAPGDGVFAPALIKALTESAEDAIVCCDVGQHQMWVAQHASFRSPEQHLTSGGLGTMGFGLPAAVGAQLACPERAVVVVTGDGSFMMNLQELATMRRYDLPIKIVLLDNSGLGLVRQWQECFFEKRYSEVDLSDNPDFGAVAAAFGIPAMRVTRRADVPPALERLRRSEGPMLLHVVIDSRENVWPLVPPNAANGTMLEEVPACGGTN